MRVAIALMTISLVGCGNTETASTRITDQAGGAGGTVGASGAGGGVVFGSGGTGASSSGGAVGTGGAATGGSGTHSDGGPCTDSCDPGAATACDANVEKACLVDSDGCKRMAPCGKRICSTAGPCANVVIQQWGASGGGFARGVAFDSNGDVYVASSTSQGLPMAAPFVGSQDGALAKWSSTGSPLWSIPWGTEGPDVSYDVAVDRSNRPYTVGAVQGTLYGEPPFEIDLQHWDIGMIRTSPAGDVQWATEWGSDADDSPSAMTFDAKGDLYVAGTTQGFFDGFSAIGMDDVFVTKWSNDKKVWTRHFGSTDRDYPSAIAVDASGSIYIAGSTYGALPGMTAGGNTDAYLAKWNADATFAWVQQWGTNEGELVSSIAVVGDKIYVVGAVDHSVANPTVYNPAATDAYIALFDPTGKQQWLKPWGGVGKDSASSVVADSAGNLFVCGQVDDSVDSGKPVTASDAFLWKFDASGQEQWHISWGSPSFDTCGEIAIGPSGLLAAVGGSQTDFNDNYDLSTRGGPWVALIRPE